MILATMPRLIAQIILVLATMPFSSRLLLDSDLFSYVDLALTISYESLAYTHLFFFFPSKKSLLICDLREDIYTWMGKTHSLKSVLSNTQNTLFLIFLKFLNLKVLLCLCLRMGLDVYEVAVI